MPVCEESDATASSFYNVMASMVELYRCRKVAALERVLSLCRTGEVLGPNDSSAALSGRPSWEKVRGAVNMQACRLGAGQGNGHEKGRNGV